MTTSLRISAMHEVTETENTMRGFTWFTNLFPRQASVVTDTDEAPVVVNTNEELVADLRRKMKNGLRVAFNCADMLSKVLEVPAMGPNLGSDGESVVVQFPTVSFVVRPYDEQMIVTIQGQTTATVFHTPNGGLAHGDQIMMIGLLGLSQRDNPTLDNNASLTGVTEASSLVA